MVKKIIAEIKRLKLFSEDTYGDMSYNLACDRAIKIIKAAQQNTNEAEQAPPPNTQNETCPNCGLNAVTLYCAACQCTIEQT